MNLLKQTALSLFWAIIVLMLLFIAATLGAMLYTFC